ncbi:ubiquitin-conjugating enzyme E2 variant [Fistulifera solaris]|uniref:Ubiquitin-conjugating enzyme E2 variant n=1 Tax=Fistulifera solaris TaxID=1519565 RepID=A0A1Z5KSK0_FISSO|nr:ubiquitin-conjugating enzyme E2 variant [Fistulifera solaris]|eukprot:GAX29072.1 ubiquitin-conjugating enzyme E2 variant [Fistulifera solaris]
MHLSILVSACAVVSVQSFTVAPSVHRRPSPFSLSSAPSLNNQQEFQETSEVTNKKSWKDDGFVFGLSDSGLQRPKGKVAMTVVDGDSLETKPYQVVLVLSTLFGHAAFFMNAMMGIWAQQNYQLGPAALQTTSLTLASWVLADLGSGILHWSVDNYGNGRTPIMGGIIAAFQGHHSAPWTITQRGFCNNVYKLCLPFGLAPVTLLTWLGAGPQTILFATTFCVLEILSQEFHKWSHMLGSETPGWVNRLQALGLTVSRKTHGLHHLAPYEGNYSIISGVTNRILDQTGFFRRLEHLIYRWNGVEANAWKLDAELKERTLRGDYSLRKG